MTTGENLIKDDSAKIAEISKDSIAFELESSHSVSLGNMIALEITVSFGDQRHSLKIIGKVLDRNSPSGDEKDGIQFTLKLLQYNKDTWNKILKVFEEKQGEVTSLFKQIRGR